MRAWILFVIALSLSVLGRAQERTATVKLENGTEVTGRVVAMDLKQLQLVVGEKIVTIEAADIKSCRFGESAESAKNPSGEPPSTQSRPGDATPGETPPAETQPGAAPLGETQPGVQPGTAPLDNAPALRRGSRPSNLSASESLGRAKTVPSATSIGGEPESASSRLGARIAVVDEFYPWLSPTDSFQWLSIVLLLIAGLSLIVHISVVVAGAENAAIGRSIGLAIFYFIAGFSQLALVPGNDFGVFSMLIGNTAVVLFSVSKLFRLARSNAFVAFAVQIGLVVVGFGLLQLVDSLLGSVSVQ